MNLPTLKQKRRAARQKRAETQRLTILKRLLSALEADVSAFEELNQYEEFLVEVSYLYGVRNPEPIYEQWVMSPNHTPESLAALLEVAG